MVLYCKSLFPAFLVVQVVVARNAVDSSATEVRGDPHAVETGGRKQWKPETAKTGETTNRTGEPGTDDGERPGGLTVG